MATKIRLPFQVNIENNSTINLNNSRLTNLAAPQDPNDAATKAYVDSVKFGIKQKDPVMYAINIDFDIDASYSSGWFIDYGMDISQNNRILLLRQTNKVQNGIWEFYYDTQTQRYKLRRPADFDVGSSAAGVAVFVLSSPDPDSSAFIQNPDLYQYYDFADTGFICTTDPAVAVVGTNQISFSVYTTLGGITAVAPIMKNGSQISLSYDPNHFGINDGKLSIVEGATVQKINAQLNGTTQGAFTTINFASTSGNSVSASTTVNGNVITIKFDHLTTQGHKHVPDATNQQGKFLKTTDSSGNFSWQSIQVSDVTGRGVLTLQPSNNYSTSSTTSTTFDLSSSPLFTIYRPDQAVNTTSDVAFNKLSLGTTNTSFTYNLTLNNGTIGSLVASGGTGFLLKTNNTFTNGNILSVNNNASVVLSLDYSGKLTLAKGKFATNSTSTEDQFTFEANTISDSSSKIFKITYSGSDALSLDKDGNLKLNGKLAAKYLYGYIVREVPAGTKNGINKTFTLSKTPIANSEMVFLNGLLQNGGGNDYTLNVSTKTITFVDAPVADDVILVTYLANEDVQ